MFCTQTLVCLFHECGNVVRSVGSNVSLNCSSKAAVSRSRVSDAGDIGRGVMRRQKSHVGCVKEKMLPRDWDMAYIL